METTIYERYRRRGTSLEMTTSLIQDLLSERLRPEFRKIWIYNEIFKHWWIKTIQT
jgi:hypothetical protein